MDGEQAAPNPAFVEDWRIGNVVKVKPSIGEEVEAEIFGYDTKTDLLILTEHATKSVRFIRGSTIQSQVVVSRKQTHEEDSDLPHLNHDRIRAREEVSVAKVRQDIANTNYNASPQAQALFNNLARTLPCQWSQNDIIIFDEIKITHPYTANFVSGGTREAMGLVLKTLEAERKKLGM